jgi:cytochrome c-type biogenesis protein CcmH/NrfG
MKRLATLLIVVMPPSGGAAADCTGQRKAVAASPQNFELHLAVAACETRLGHPQLATESYRQAARLRPSEPGIWNDLGANLIAIGRDEEAVSALRKATALNPKGESAWFNLGGTLLKLGRPGEAFTALDNAAKLAPRDQEIQAARREAATRLLATAETHVRRREYAQAQKLLNAAPLPDSAAWNNLTGYAEFKLNQPVPALDHLQKAVRLEPENESYLLDIGELLVHYRASKAAREIFEIAAVQKPRSVPVQFMLAVNYILEDRRPEGIAVLKNILELDPDFEPAYRALGECYDEAKDAESLVKLGEQLVARSTRSATGFHLKGLGLLWMAIESRAPLDPAIDARHEA